MCVCACVVYVLRLFLLVKWLESELERAQRVEQYHTQSGETAAGTESRDMKPAIDSQVDQASARLVVHSTHCGRGLHGWQ